MVKTTRKFIEESKEMKDVICKMGSISDIVNMSEEDFKLCKMGFQIFDTSLELLEKQAKIIEDLDRKLDKILGLLQKKEV